ncbi:MAG: phosphoenolpyruvate--protein phosphotransferase [Planctomycetes bacterium]|nr:phosphoenolpyruvate--protein phosphotransferase [Planctomycetota bacterium]
MARARTVHGTSVSPGLAIGPVHVVRAAPDAVPHWSVPEDEVGNEIERLRAAVVAAGDELQRRQRLVASQSGERDAQIFAVHRMILQDPSAVRDVEETIRGERINAESAVQHFIQRLERTFRPLEGNSVRSYSADLSDPWREVLQALMHVVQSADPDDGKVILAAAVLTPQVVTSVARERLLGIVAEAGGRFSHAAVLARAFGVPCVVGLPGLLQRLEQGMTLALDGGRGSVELRPNDEQVSDFHERKSRLDARRANLAEQSALPARTTDGAELRVLVNIESLRDFDIFDVAHTDGIGLCRTEFLYMERPQFPSEDEQFRMYRRVLERMAPRPVTLRTLDIGGDKRLPYFQTPEEANPALGWRGLRVSLEWQDLLRVQIRAALRAGVGRDMRLLLPMVASLEEVLATHKIFDGVRGALLEQGWEVDSDVPVGIMIEVPSVLLCLDELLAHVDFVSVGTNDLVQYLLAVDRDNPWVSKLYEPLHPAVVRALAQIAKAARNAGKPCSVCGDMADDPAVAVMLLGLGYDSVSVAPYFLPEIKYAVRKVSLATARGLADDVLAQSTVEGVKRVLSNIRDALHA